MCIVLRYASGNIVLFEALGDTGVTLTDWKDFVDYKWNEGYNKIVFRKLHIGRTLQMLTEFEAFIKASLGKPYKIKTSKMCCNKKKPSAQMHPGDVDQTIDQAIKGGKWSA